MGCDGQVTARLVAGPAGECQCRAPGGAHGPAQGNTTMETMTVLQWLLDGTLVLALLWLAWRALSSPDLFTAIVLFVAFGLMMALAWVRLQAPDIALAEAAIGAGLTGALLLAALARLNDLDDSIDDGYTVDTEKR